MTQTVQSPELQSKLALWRAKVTDGTITLDELREAIKLMREDRHSAADAAAKSKSGARGTKPPTRSADDLLGELGI